jgi:uroporphyrinogen decarboxylase
MSRKAMFLNALRGGKPSAPVWAEMYIDENLKKEFASEIPVGMTFEEYAGMSAISLAGPYYPPGFIEEIDGVMTPQLQNRGDLGKMVFPDADDERFYEPAKKFLANAPEGLAIGVSTDLAAGAALASMGVEGFSYALADDPDFVAEVFMRYGEWSAKVHRNLCKMGFDFVWSGGDIAFNTGPFFSPEVFRTIILPAMRKSAVEITVPWIYHSDGNLNPILEDLLSLGMNGLHPFEPGGMDILATKQKYGNKLCVVGNVDIDLLTRGTSAEVENQATQIINSLAPLGGHIISSSNGLASYVKAENVRAMMQAVSTPTILKEL